MKPKTFRIISWGGIGDVLLSTPAFKALKQRFPGCRIHVFCLNEGHRAVYRHNPYIDRLSLASFAASPVNFVLHRLKLRQFYQFDYAALRPSKYYRKNATEVIAEMMGLTLTDKNVQLYLLPGEEEQAARRLQPYPNPVLMHITSKCAQNQHWPLENWAKLVAALDGQCTFIQVGLPGEPHVPGAVDLRGKTSLREVFALLKAASGFVGVTSSFSHATNAFGTPGVVLFGPSAPEVWGHANNVNLSRNLPCAPCIDVLHNAPCPYGAECMHIPVAQVQEALRRQLRLPVPQPALAVVG